MHSTSFAHLLGLAHIGIINGHGHNEALSGAWLTPYVLWLTCVCVVLPGSASSGVLRGLKAMVYCLVTAGTGLLPGSAATSSIAQLGTGSGFEYTLM
jgi:hypothetical protein